MKNFIKDLTIGIIIEIVLGALTLLVWRFELIKTGAYLIILFGCISAIGWVTWFAYRIYMQHEITRRNNVLMNNIFIENWVHIMALLESDTERWKVMNAKEGFKESLGKAWSEKYKRKLRMELCKIYPKKTEPQINKILDSYLSV
jgi:hypothetical protein